MGSDNFLDNNINMVKGLVSSIIKEINYINRDKKMFGTTSEIQKNKKEFKDELKDIKNELENNITDINKLISNINKSLKNGEKINGKSNNCPIGKIKSPKSGRCVKECNKNQYRSKKTGRCRNN